MVNTVPVKDQRTGALVYVKENFAGKHFGDWEVLGFHHRSGPTNLWSVRCRCGKEDLQRQYEMYKLGLCPHEASMRDQDAPPLWVVTTEELVHRTYKVHATSLADALLLCQDQGTVALATDKVRTEVMSVTRQGA
jgi:hypothetical protein